MRGAANRWKEKNICNQRCKEFRKTTLICRLLEIFKDKGLKVAVLKHDGHDFVPDVPGTDTYCQLQSGAYGTAVFSGQIYAGKTAAADFRKELAEFFRGRSDLTGRI